MKMLGKGSLLAALAGGAIGVGAATVAAPKISEAINRWRRRRQRERRTGTEKAITKRGTFAEAAEVGRGQKDKDTLLSPRNEGWQTVEHDVRKGPHGQMVERVVRIRTFGRLSKLAFAQGLLDGLSL